MWPKTHNGRSRRVVLFYMRRTLAQIIKNKMRLRLRSHPGHFSSCFLCVRCQTLTYCIACPAHSLFVSLFHWHSRWLMLLTSAGEEEIWLACSHTWMGLNFVFMRLCNQINYGHGAWNYSSRVALDHACVSNAWIWKSWSLENHLTNDRLGTKECLRTFWLRT